MLTTNQMWEIAGKIMKAVQAYKEPERIGTFV